MSFSASVSIANMAAANAAMQSDGWGDGNFSVPVFTGSAQPSVAVMHHFATDAACRASAAAIPGVTVRDYGVMQVGMEDTCTALGGRWGGNAPLLVGSVSPGLYRASEADGGGLWNVIQAFDRSVFNLALATYPALVRQAHVPGEVTAWVQPIDTNDAYRPANRFTGLPDQVDHNGQTWECTQGDGAGNNSWVPGVFGWTAIG
jgi:hypothetical protein